MESPTFGKTALIHQTKEILTSKPTFTQGVSVKLLKNGEHKSPPEHTFIWRELEINNVMPMVRLELTTPGLQTQCSSHWAIQLKSYCWEGVEFIQLVYCIIIYLSFLNCDWLLIQEVQWFYWTQELLVPVEKFTVRMPMVNSQPLDLTISLYDTMHVNKTILTSTIGTHEEII